LQGDFLSNAPDVVARERTNEQIDAWIVAGQPAERKSRRAPKPARWRCQPLVRPTPMNETILRHRRSRPETGKGLG